MKLNRIAIISLAATLLATEPNDATKRWWSHVVALANDGMEGRDTGSPGYVRAEQYVVAQFEKAGLKPAGEKGYLQTVPLHVVRLRTDQSSVELVRADGPHKLAWLRQISTGARTSLPKSVEGDMVFLGNGPEAGAAAIDAQGKIVVQMPRRTPAPDAAAAPGRGAAGGGGRGGAPRSGAAATIAIDTTGGAEPPRWPASYSVAMSLAESTARAAAEGPVTFRFNPAFAEELFAGSGHTFVELQKLVEEGKPLPQFTIPAKFRATMTVESSEISSDNIAAVLPGSDPALADQYLVVSAHLDGYGIGEPWNGDRIYNGAFDDAAYVATLIDLAQKLHDSHTQLKRSLLFLVVTGEEKGLLGSKYFAAHPTIAKEKLIADINLDQLRPIFPLKTLTMLAVDESTLGLAAKEVAGKMGIKIQPDPEPERRLLTRSDHYSFMQIGVPATGFIFGYEKGSPEEEVYRHWYAERYHSPADDINQPWDPPAAAKFNDFFGRLVETVANAADKPKWREGSTFAHADIR
jgi:Peptidase family M28